MNCFGKNTNIVLNIVKIIRFSPIVSTFIGKQCLFYGIHGLLGSETGSIYVLAKSSSNSIAIDFYQ